MIKITSNMSNEKFEVNKKEVEVYHKTIAFIAPAHKVNKTILQNIDDINMARTLNGKELLYFKPEGSDVIKVKSFRNKVEAKEARKQLNKTKKRIIEIERVRWGDCSVVYDNMVMQRKRVSYLFVNPDDTVYHKRLL